MPNTIDLPLDPEPLTEHELYGAYRKSLIQRHICLNGRLGTVIEAAIMSRIVGLITFALLTAANPCIGAPTTDEVYANYRDGTIRRHIAANGSYLASVLLRSADAIDLGQLPAAPDATALSLRANARVDDDRAAPLLPLAYREVLTGRRNVPAGMNRKRSIGYVLDRPEVGAVPLYEWQRGAALDPTPSEDWYYDTDPEARVARNRYFETGIVGYVIRDPDPWRQNFNLASLFSGFDPIQRRHFLSVDKSPPPGVKDWRSLGYVFVSPKSRFGTKAPHMWAFDEYGRPNTVAQSGRFYSASRARLMTSMPKPLKFRAPAPKPIFAREHFWLREVLAGGGDNPLYQTGLALGVFALEFKHSVSQASLAYARRLFDFIEASEEQGFGILEVGPADCIASQSCTGYLRRTRNYWSDATTWGASTDELIGVLFGLQQFAKVTASADPAYHERVKRLASRIGTRLWSQHWIYLDSRYRLAGSDVAGRLRALAGGTAEDRDNLGRAMGTLAFQKPISHVLEDITGSNSRRDFNEGYQLMIDLMDSELPNPVSDSLKELTLMLTLSVGKCVVELWKDKDLYDPACGVVIDTHREFYDYLVRNSGAYGFYSDGKDSDGKGNFFNYTMIAYLGLMMLETDSLSAEPEQVTRFAQAYVGFVNALFGATAVPTYYGSSDWYYTGPGRNNALLALVAKLAMSKLSDGQIEESFLGSKDGQARQYERYRFKLYVDKVLANTGYPATLCPWQSALPIQSSSYAATGPGLGSTAENWQPEGIGRNAAWEHGNESFAMPADGLASWMTGSTGPWYPGPACTAIRASQACSALGTGARQAADSLARADGALFAANQEALSDHHLSPEEEAALKPLRDAAFSAFTAAVQAEQEVIRCESEHPPVCGLMPPLNAELPPETRTFQELALRSHMTAFMPALRRQAMAPAGFLLPGPAVVIEAGGNDLMVLRMLMTEFGFAPAPLLPTFQASETVPILPVRAVTPWTRQGVECRAPSQPCGVQLSNGNYEHCLSAGMQCP